MRFLDEKEDGAKKMVQIIPSTALNSYRCWIPPLTGF